MENLVLRGYLWRILAYLVTNFKCQSLKFSHCFVTFHGPTHVTLLIALDQSKLRYDSIYDICAGPGARLCTWPMAMRGATTHMLGH